MQDDPFGGNPSLGMGTAGDPFGDSYDPFSADTPRHDDMTNPDGNLQQVQDQTGKPLLQINPAVEKTWWDAITDVVRHPISYTPYLNTLDLVTVGRQYAAARAVERGDATAEQQKTYQDFLSEQNQKTSFGYDALHTAFSMVPFLFEFLGAVATGGAAASVSLGKTASKQAMKGGLEAIMENMARKGAGKILSTIGLKDAATDWLQSPGMQKWALAYSADALGATRAIGAAKAAVESAATPEAKEAAMTALERLMASEGRDVARAAGKDMAQTALGATGEGGLLVRPLSNEAAWAAVTKGDIAKQAALRLGTVAGLVTVGASPFAGLPFPKQLIESTLTRMMPDVKMSEDEKGQLSGMITGEGDDFLPAFAKSFYGGMVSNLAAQAGDLLYIGHNMWGKNVLQLGEKAMGEQAQPLVGWMKNLAVVQGVQRNIARGMGDESVKHFISEMSDAGWKGYWGNLVAMQGASLLQGHVPTGEEFMSQALAFAAIPTLIGAHAYSKGQISAELLQKHEDFNALKELHAGIETPEERKQAAMGFAEIYQAGRQADQEKPWLVKLLSLFKPTKGTVLDQLENSPDADLHTKLTREYREPSQAGITQADIEAQAKEASQQTPVAVTNPDGTLRLMTEQEQTVNQTAAEQAVHKEISRKQEAVFKNANIRLALDQLCSEALRTKDGSKLADFLGQTIDKSTVTATDARNAAALRQALKGGENAPAFRVEWLGQARVMMNYDQPMTMERKAELMAAGVIPSLTAEESDSVMGLIRDSNFATLSPDQFANPDWLRQHLLLRNDPEMAAALAQILPQVQNSGIFRDIKLGIDHIALHTADEARAIGLTPAMLTKTQQVRDGQPLFALLKGAAVIPNADGTRSLMITPSFNPAIAAEEITHAIQKSIRVPGQNVDVKSPLGAAMEHIKQTSLAHLKQQLNGELAKNRPDDLQQAMARVSELQGRMNSLQDYIKTSSMTEEEKVQAKAKLEANMRYLKAQMEELAEALKVKQMEAALAGMKGAFDHARNVINELEIGTGAINGGTTSYLSHLIRQIEQNNFSETLANLAVGHFKLVDKNSAKDARVYLGLDEKGSREVLGKLLEQSMGKDLYNMLAAYGLKGEQPGAFGREELQVPLRKMEEKGIGSTPVDSLYTKMMEQEAAAGIESQPPSDVSKQHAQEFNATALPVKALPDVAAPTSLPKVQMTDQGLSIAAQQAISKHTRDLERFKAQTRKQQVAKVQSQIINLTNWLNEHSEKTITPKDALQRNEFLGIRSNLEDVLKTITNPSYVRRNKRIGNYLNEQQARLAETRGPRVGPPTYMQMPPEGSKTPDEVAREHQDANLRALEGDREREAMTVQDEVGYAKDTHEVAVEALRELAPERRPEDLEVSEPKNSTLQALAAVADDALAADQRKHRHVDIVSDKAQHDVYGMRGPGGNTMTNTVPGQRGWLGNPNKWEGNGDAKGVTVQDAIEAFRRDFLAKVDSDPVFRQAVLDLDGKKLGYYRPDQPNHLQVVKEWLEAQPAPEATQVPPAPQEGLQQPPAASTTKLKVGTQRAKRSDDNQLTIKDAFASGLLDANRYHDALDEMDTDIEDIMANRMTYRDLATNLVSESLADGKDLRSDEAQNAVEALRQTMPEVISRATNMQRALASQKNDEEARPNPAVTGEQAHYRPNHAPDVDKLVPYFQHQKAWNVLRSDPSLLEEAGVNVKEFDKIPGDELQGFLRNIMGDPQEAKGLRYPFDADANNRLAYLDKHLLDYWNEKLDQLHAKKDTFQLAKHGMRLNELSSHLDCLLQTEFATTHNFGSQRRMEQEHLGAPLSNLEAVAKENQPGDNEAGMEDERTQGQKKTESKFDFEKAVRNTDFDQAVPPLVPPPRRSLERAVKGIEQAYFVSDGRTLDQLRPAIKELNKQFMSPVHPTEPNPIYEVDLQFTSGDKGNLTHGAEANARAALLAAADGPGGGLVILAGDQTLLAHEQLARRLVKTVETGRWQGIASLDKALIKRITLLSELHDPEVLEKVQKILAVHGMDEAQARAFLKEDPTKFRRLVKEPIDALVKLGMSRERAGKVYAALRTERSKQIIEDRMETYVDAPAFSRGWGTWNHDGTYDGPALPYLILRQEQALSPEHTADVLASFLAEQGITHPVFISFEHPDQAGWIKDGLQALLKGNRAKTDWQAATGPDYRPDGSNAMKLKGDDSEAFKALVEAHTIGYRHMVDSVGKLQPIWERISKHYERALQDAEVPAPIIERTLSQMKRDFDSRSPVLQANTLQMLREQFPDKGVYPSQSELIDQLDHAKRVYEQGLVETGGPLGRQTRGNPNLVMPDTMPEQTFSQRAIGQRVQQLRTILTPSQAFRDLNARRIAEYEASQYGRDVSEHRTDLQKSGKPLIEAQRDLAATELERLNRTHGYPYDEHPVDPGTQFHASAAELENGIRKIEPFLWSTLLRKGSKENASRYLYSWKSAFTDPQESQRAMERAAEQYYSLSPTKRNEVDAEHGSAAIAQAILDGHDLARRHADQQLELPGLETLSHAQSLKSVMSEPSWKAMVGASGLHEHFWKKQAWMRAQGEAAIAQDIAWRKRTKNADGEVPKYLFEAMTAQREDFELNKMKGFEDAPSNTEIIGKHAEVFNDIAAKYDEAFQEFNKAARDFSDVDFVKYLKHYVPHRFARPDGLPLTDSDTRWALESNRTKARKIPTYQEAQDHGLVPITLDIGKLYQQYVGDMAKVVTHKTMLELAMHSVDVDGNPLVIGITPEMLNPDGKYVGPRLEDTPEREKLVLNTLRRLSDLDGKTAFGKALTKPFAALADLLKTKTNLTRQYVSMEAPYKGFTKFLVHPDAKNTMDMLLQNKWDNSFWQGVQHFNTWTKFLGLSLSAFHYAAVTESYWSAMAHRMGQTDVKVMQSIKDAYSGKLRQSYEDRVDFMKDAAEHGLGYSMNEDIDMGVIDNDIKNFETFAKATGIPGFLGLVKGLRWMEQANNKKLWYDIHGGFKLYAYEGLIKDAIEQGRLAGKPLTMERIDALKYETARYLNKIAGGLDWNQFAWATPKARQLMHLMLFAPDWCVPTDTRAMTKTGFKYQHELKAGDEILIFDPQTQTTRWGQLNDKFFRRDYSGDMVNVRSYRRSIAMTPEHTCYVVDSRKNRRVLKAKELLNAHQIPRIASHGLAETATVSDKLVVLAGWLVTDDYIKRKTHRLANGQETVYRYGRITQSKPAMVARLKALGLKFYSEKIKDHDAFVGNFDKYTFTIPVEDFYALERVGVVDGKMSWDFMRRLTRSQLELLEETMMLGDGTGQHRFCGEEPEVFQMTLLRTMLGKACTFWEQKQAGQRCWLTRCITSKTITCANDALSTQHYEGEIWCPSVDTGFWVAERNGLIFITGNTVSNIMTAGLGKAVGYSYTPWERRQLATHYWPAMLTTLVIMPNLFQAGIYGAFGGGSPDDRMFSMENEEGKQFSVDITPITRKLGFGGPSGKERSYLRYGKQAWEIAGLLNAPQETLMSKTSMAFKLAFEQATGTNVSGWELPFKREGFWESVADGSRVADITEKFMPMSISSLLEGKPSSFFAPVSAGMTPARAEKSIQAVIEAYADPHWWDQVRGRPDYQQNLAALVPQILDAAERNGVDPKMVVDGGVRYAKTRYYQNLFKAINSGNHSEMERAALAVVRLGAGENQVKQSLERKMKRLGAEPDPVTQKTIDDLIADAEKKLAGKGH